MTTTPEQLKLRSNSTNNPYGDITTGKVLSHIEVDSNFVNLKGLMITTATTENNVTILHRLNGGAISFIGGGSGSGDTTTSDVTSMVNTGAIIPGELIPSGTTLQGFIETLLLTTFEPTFTNPTYSLSSNQASGQEIGVELDILLTYNYNQGSINGKIVGGIWQPATFQDYRGGVASNYTIDGVDTNLTNTYTVTGHILLNTQSFNATMTYLEGPQPIDSDGNNYSTPLAAGSELKTRTITAIYPYFYGKVTGGSKPIKNQTLIDSGTKVVGSSTGTITIDYNSTSDDWLWFAIPVTSPSSSKTTWYINALNNGDIGGTGNLFDTGVDTSIDSPTSLWNGILYEIYVSNYKSEITDNIQLRN